MTTEAHTNGYTIVERKEIPVRDIWSNEARDFTPWLADNIDRLSTILNRELDVIECEKSVGPFSADIYAKDEYGNKVVIENQLEKTDHDHAGKLMTYGANLDVKVFVWITPKARHEHINLINWYNTHLDNDIQCYLIEILTHEIDGKNVTLDLKTICEPNDVTDAIKIINKGDDIIEQKKMAFWTQFTNINKYNGIAKETKNSFKYRYIEMQTPGIARMPWQYIIKSKSNIAEIFFYGETKDMYSSFLLHKEDIERDFGEILIWTTGENKKGSRITSESDMGGLNDQDKWDEIQSDMIDRMTRLQNAIKKYME